MFTLARFGIVRFGMDLYFSHVKQDNCKSTQHYYTVAIALTKWKQHTVFAYILLLHNLDIRMWHPTDCSWNDIFIT